MTTTPTAAEVQALRLRLYRPDPPVDAVDAYLLALRRAAAETPAEPPAPPPTSAPARRAARRVVPAVLGGAAILAGLAALPLATRHLPAVASLPTPTPTPAGAERYPPVPGVELGVLAGSRASSGIFDAAGHVAIVSVNCSGTGTITLRLGQEHPTVLTCQAGGPALAMLESPGPLGVFPITVAPTRGVRWALAVGAVPAG